MSDSTEVVEKSYIEMLYFRKTAVEFMLIKEQARNINMNNTNYNHMALAKGEFNHMTPFSTTVNQPPQSGVGG